MTVDMSRLDVPLPAVEAATRRELCRYSALRARIDRDLAEDGDTDPTTPEEGN